MSNKQDIFIKMVLDTWNAKINQCDKLMAELSDEQLMQEVSPGRNRGIYIFGHLTVMINFMQKQLGYGENPTPHLIDFFIKNPDRTFDVMPGVADVRQDWAAGKALIEKNMATTNGDEWFEAHTSVSAEDFAKEPHRNKLNLVLSRASHFDYHLGQLIFLKTK